MPGSPEAVEADRAKDRLRKARARERDLAALAAAAPSPPAATPPPPGALPAATANAAPGFVPWAADDFAPLVAELVPAVEAARVERVMRRVRQIPDLPKGFAEECRELARWPAAAKTTLVNRVPRMSAKWLNAAGISAEYADEIIVGSALLAIVVQDRKLMAKLEELAARAEPPPAPAP